MSRKPLNRKAYGSIPHFPNSRLGPSDKQANEGHIRIATEKVRDKNDRIYVTEKIDGSNVAVAKLNGEIIPLTRSGYLADTSPYIQHHYWKDWVFEHIKRFDELLNDGEWVVGEWCIQAHSTKYCFPGEPWFGFDIFRNGERTLYEEFCYRLLKLDFEQPMLWQCSFGRSILIDEAMSLLREQPLGWHGALETIEGFVYRVERRNKFDFLIKYVRPEKKDGIYLMDEDRNQLEPTWNSWGTKSKSIKHLKTGGT